MATFHYLHLRTFAHATEDAGKVREALRRAAQDDAGKLALEETPVEGANGNRIVIVEAEQRSSPAAKRLFEALARDDPAGFARVVAEQRRRLDEHLNFHLRLDKQEAYAGRVVLAPGEDAITVRGKLRSFEPKRSGNPGAAEADLDAFLQGIARRAS